MEDVSVEYFNAPRLTRFYLDGMDHICRDYLDYAGFIYQAIKVGKLVYKFYDKNGSTISLDLGNIDKVLKIGLDLNYQVENGTNLVLKTLDTSDINLEDSKGRQRLLSLAIR